MLGKRSYMLNWDCQKGLWQVSSLSGHVIYESASRHEVSAVCSRLNRQFPRRRMWPMRPAVRARMPRPMAQTLLANLLPFPQPVVG